MENKLGNLTKDRTEYEVNMSDQKSKFAAQLGNQVG
jgi:hypothetical protein